MKLFKRLTMSTPFMSDFNPSPDLLKRINSILTPQNSAALRGTLNPTQYMFQIGSTPLTIGTGKAGKSVQLEPISELVNWKQYPDACLWQVKDDETSWAAGMRRADFATYGWLNDNEFSNYDLNTKEFKTPMYHGTVDGSTKGNTMNNENKVVPTEVSINSNQGTTIKTPNNANLTAAIHALTTDLETGEINQAQFDEMVESMAEDMVAPTVEPEVTVEPSDWVPAYSLKDRLMDLAFNRALNMCQNHTDRFQVEAIIKPLMEATEAGYSPESWLVTLRQIAQRMSDPKHHFTVARTINLTMRGITLSLNDRLAGQGKGFGTSHDAKLTHAQSELEQAEANGDFEVARMIREEILEMELNVASEQESGVPYAGNSWLNSELPQDYDVLIDIANQYAMGARRLYTKLNLGQSDDPMKFQVWSVNANVENPNEPPVWVDIETFGEALDALESANARRNVQRKIDAELLSTQVERARLDMTKAARTEKAVAAKKATAKMAQQAITTAKAKMVNNEIQRNLGLVEHMCNGYKAGELSNEELANAVLNIVADHDLLTPKTAEAFVIDYCERNELDSPLSA